MENPIFRKKSLERITSPEQLNDYIRVANPGIWLMLSAVVILLIGLLAWSVFGQLESRASASAVVEGGVATCYISEDDMSSIALGAAVYIADGRYALESIAQEPVDAGSALNDYALSVGGFQSGEWVYAATLPVPLPDGVYSAQIVTDSISPISFVLN